MKIKKLKFVDRFIDTKPEKNNQWRGILAYCDDIIVYQISYFEEKEDADEKSEFIINSGMITLELNPDRKKFYTKENVMDHCQDVFETYINKFLE